MTQNTFVRQQPLITSAAVTSLLAYVFNVVVTYMPDLEPIRGDVNGIAVILAPWLWRRSHGSGSHRTNPTQRRHCSHTCQSTPRM